MLGRAKYKWQHRDDRFGHHAVEYTNVDAHHIEAADLQLFDIVLFGAKAAGRIDAHTESSLGLVTEQLAHVLYRRDSRIIARMDIRRSEIAGDSSG